jgi:dynein heavy chain 1, cytosolic
MNLTYFHYSYILNLFDIGHQLEEQIVELEAKILQYKTEYAQLISEAQSIKTSLCSVEGKVERSISLLKSLSTEQTRWQWTSQQLIDQLTTIIGDCLLNAAFLTYSGYYDQAMRESLLKNWTFYLKQVGVQLRQDIKPIDYLSNADQKLKWQQNGLPVDDVCTENAILLQNFKRYPLVIDPSGQAIQFILNEYKNKKIIKTSFNDANFRKQLESALRFGSPILVQDAENYDSILNPILNRELRHINGRTLISIGDQDIDFSPSFNIFLSTRDATCCDHFSLEILSRVTFVNFTVTRSSLQSQCLNQVLKSERPDIDEKKRDLVKTQGEFQQRLRYLEKGLLQALNDAKGKILDDDNVLTKLESLKTEATEISLKIKETDQVLSEIEEASQKYMPLANACSIIYFSMEALSQVSYLYQYSLQFFNEMYSFVLENSVKPSNEKESLVNNEERLIIITKSLFKIVYSRVSRGMLYKDRLVFAMLLLQAFIKCGNR